MSDTETNSTTSKYPQFDPQQHTENLLEAFNEYLNGFEYAYQDIAKDPPATAANAATWINTNKRKIFLGKFATRNLQKEYEETTTEKKREPLWASLKWWPSLENVSGLFRLSGNSSLANYKFRKIVQRANESWICLSYV